MKQSFTFIPAHPLIETKEIPIKWLHDLALREGNSKRPIYQIHKWWARRLSSVFRALLLLAINPSSTSQHDIIADYYSKHDYEGLICLDPFMGGGTSVIEASKLNIKTVGVDIDPIATFITKKELEHCPIEKIKSTFSKLEKRVGEKIKRYYITRLSDGTFAPVVYYFWVDLLDCPECGVTFEAHPHFMLGFKEKENIRTVFCRNCHFVTTIGYSDEKFECPSCGASTSITKGNVGGSNYSCPNCSHQGLISSLSNPEHPFEKRLFAVEYQAKGNNGKYTSFYKAADNYDIGVYLSAVRRFEQEKDQLPFPRNEIPTEGRSDPRPINYGYKHYYQLFNKRQLLSLSLIFREIISIEDPNVREYLILAFSDSLASNNLLCRYAFGYKKLTPLFGLHAYSIVNRPVENNVWGAQLGRGSFAKCVNKVLKGKEFSEKPYEVKYRDNTPTKVFTGESISCKATSDPNEWLQGRAECLILNQSSANLECLADNSVDLILTDPPYYNNLSYSELSDFYYVWLREQLHQSNPHQTIPTAISTPYLDALFVNGNSTHDPFIKDLSNVFSHCNRLLKPNGLMIFTFHHKSVSAWDALAQSLWRANLCVTNVFPVRSEGKSGFHSSKGTIKWDSVIVTRPKKNHKNQEIPSDFIEKIKSDLLYWKQRFETEDLSFQSADEKSFGFSLAVQQASNYATSPHQITELLSIVNKRMNKDLLEMQENE